MANISNVTASWQSVTITADEIWQVRDGAVCVDTDAANQLGLLLRSGEAVRISAGKTVYYKLNQGSSALIARVAV